MDTRAQVSCIACGTKWQKSLNSMQTWKGRCRSCAQKLAKGTPKSRAESAIRARAQVLKQGGIPNARKITLENRHLFRRRYAPFTTERRLKHSVSLPKGRNHHAWKGGLTSEDRKVRLSLKYKIWREAVFARDNWACVLCGAKSGVGNRVYLNADHIKSFADYPDLRLCVDNGRTLCVPCHKGTANFGCKGRGVLSPKEVREIRAALAVMPRKTQRQIADQYGVTQRTVWMISKNVTWKHIV